MYKGIADTVKEEEHGTCIILNVWLLKSLPFDFVYAQCKIGYKLTVQIKNMFYYLKIYLDTCKIGYICLIINVKFSNVSLISNIIDP